MKVNENSLMDLYLVAVLLLVSFLLIARAFAFELIATLCLEGSPVRLACFCNRNDNMIDNWPAINSTAYVC